MACLEFGVMLDSRRSVRFVGQEDRVDSELVSLHGVAELVPVIYFVEHYHIIWKTWLEKWFISSPRIQEKTHISIG